MKLSEKLKPGWHIMDSGGGIILCYKEFASENGMKVLVFVGTEVATIYWDSKDASSRQPINLENWERNNELVLCAETEEIILKEDQQAGVDPSGLLVSSQMQEVEKTRVLMREVFWPGEVPKQCQE